MQWFKLFVILITHKHSLMVMKMSNSAMLTAQIKYFNEQVKKDLTDEQIADVADYFNNTHNNLFVNLKRLANDINAHDFKIINSNYGICSVVNGLSLDDIDVYPIIGMLSHYFYSDYEYKNYMDKGAKRIHYPIPSKTHYERVKNQWTGVLLTRRLAYIKWLVRQFNLMIKHLEVYQTV